MLLLLPGSSSNKRSIPAALSGGKSHGWICELSCTSPCSVGTSSAAFQEEVSSSWLLGSWAVGRSRSPASNVSCASTCSTDPCTAAQLAFPVVGASGIAGAFRSTVSVASCTSICSAETTSSAIGAICASLLKAAGDSWSSPSTSSPESDCTCLEDLSVSAVVGSATSELCASWAVDDLWTSTCSLGSDCALSMVAFSAFEVGAFECEEGSVLLSSAGSCTATAMAPDFELVQPIVRKPSPLPFHFRLASGRGHVSQRRHYR
mmetsp:Transcript_46830/g.118490  ORF Transcript_46830/g.118490 Transcript_46830/m.118490 type:complete len:262 (-) Transcript_46830:175-960(-)